MRTDSGAVREELAVLSMLPAGRNERRFAAIMLLATLAIFMGLAPFARKALPAAPVFIGCYQSALFVSDLATAALLAAQFAAARLPALLVLAGGYLFTALMAVAHGLTFPGLFSPTGLLHAGSQTTAWLYMFWHGGFPLAIIVYAFLDRSSIVHMRLGATATALIAFACVLGAVVGLTILTTAGARYLPALMRGNHYTSLMIYVVGCVWSLSLAAIVLLWSRRLRSVLDLWLTIVMAAWLCDVALSALLNSGRFDLGFYAGRAYGLLASGFLLLMLLLETVALYARLARSLQSERRQQKARLAELSSELIHVSRQGDLGHVASALAHEVTQPLAAIGNFVCASDELLQVGDLERARNTLGKARQAVDQATATLQRVGSFVRKDDHRWKHEDLGVVVNEAVELAVAGATEHSVDVDLSLPPRALAAFIDKIQIQQVLLNLVRNAIEAMAENPRPKLNVAFAACADDWIEVSVRDNGPGIRADVRQKLFRPFVTSKEGGLGVGLSICRLIVEAHGGRIWAEDGPGTGSVFRFTVPSARRDPPEDPGNEPSPCA